MCVLYSGFTNTSLQWTTFGHVFIAQGTYSSFFSNITVHLYSFLGGLPSLWVPHVPSDRFGCLKSVYSYFQRYSSIGITKICRCK